MQVNARELAWAAGLFEGEGCISVDPPSGRNKKPSIWLHLGMTDVDPVDRFHAAVGGMGHRSLERRGQKGQKDLHRWTCYKFEHCQAIIAMLWFGLGERRRAKAAAVLTAYAEARR